MITSKGFSVAFSFISVPKKISALTSGLFTLTTRRAHHHKKQDIALK